MYAYQPGPHPSSYPPTSSVQSHGDQSSHPLSSSGGPPKKRPRRRFEEIERLYTCNYPGCIKAYGTLNHLNAHVSMQKHGPKRVPGEFKELRKRWREGKKKEKEDQDNEDGQGDGEDGEGAQEDNLRDEKKTVQLLQQRRDPEPSLQMLVSGERRSQHPELAIKTVTALGSVNESMSTPTSGTPFTAQQAAYQNASYAGYPPYYQPGSATTGGSWYTSSPNMSSSYGTRPSTAPSHMIHSFANSHTPTIGGGPSSSPVVPQYPMGSSSTPLTPSHPAFMSGSGLSGTLPNGFIAARKSSLGALPFGAIHEEEEEQAQDMHVRKRSRQGDDVGANEDDSIFSHVVPPQASADASLFRGTTEEGWDQAYDFAIAPSPALSPAVQIGTSFPKDGQYSQSYPNTQEYSTLPFASRENEDNYRRHDGEANSGMVSSYSTDYPAPVPPHDAAFLDLTGGRSSALGSRSGSDGSTPSAHIQQTPTGRNQPQRQEWSPDWASFSNAASSVAPGSKPQ